MQIKVISDQPLREWQQELLRQLQELDDHPIRAFAFVGLLDDEEYESMGFYWNMTTLDKMGVAGMIQRDAMLPAIRQIVSEATGIEMEEEDYES